MMSAEALQLSAFYRVEEKESISTGLTYILLNALILSPNTICWYFQGISFLFLQ